MQARPENESARMQARPENESVSVRQKERARARVSEPERETQTKSEPFDAPPFCFVKLCVCVYEFECVFECEVVSEGGE
jgi:hypothetical protein